MGIRTTNNLQEALTTAREALQIIPTAVRIEVHLFEDMSRLLRASHLLYSLSRIWRTRSPSISARKQRACWPDCSKPFLLLARLPDAACANIEKL